MMRTGHLMERCDIAVAIKLLLDSSSEWFTHGQLVDHCQSMMGYKPHNECVRLVAREMVKDGIAEVTATCGHYAYRCATALWKPGMVSKTRARK